MRDPNGAIGSAREVQNEHGGRCGVRREQDVVSVADLEQRVGRGLAAARGCAQHHSSGHVTLENPGGKLDISGFA
ncbi:MAG: hypothetical protein ACXVP8_07395 [Actinomycetota bacterium]